MYWPEIFLGPGNTDPQGLGGGGNGQAKWLFICITIYSVSLWGGSGGGRGGEDGGDEGGLGIGVG